MLSVIRNKDFLESGLTEDELIEVLLRWDCPVCIFDLKEILYDAIAEMLYSVERKLKRLGGNLKVFFLFSIDSIDSPRPYRIYVCTNLHQRGCYSQRFILNRRKIATSVTATPPPIIHEGVSPPGSFSVGFSGSSGSSGPTG